MVAAAAAAARAAGAAAAAVLRAGRPNSGIAPRRLYTRTSLPPRFRCNSRAFSDARDAKCEDKPKPDACDSGKETKRAEPAGSCPPSDQSRPAGSSEEKPKSSTKLASLKVMSSDLAQKCSQSLTSGKKASQDFIAKHGPQAKERVMKHGYGLAKKVQNASLVGLQVIKEKAPVVKETVLRKARQLEDTVLDKACQYRDARRKKLSERGGHGRKAPSKTGGSILGDSKPKTPNSQ